MNGHKLGFAPQNPVQALLIAEAHVRAIGYPFMSPLRFIRESELHEDGTLTTASTFVSAALTVKEILPGLRLRSGSSEIEVVKVIPTRKEIVYKSKKGVYRISTSKFVRLARQQGYRKVWDLKTFLETLRKMLKPILSAIPIMWILKIVTDSVRKKPVGISSRLPKTTEILDR